MGFFLGLVFLLVHLANLKSFGVSYLAPYSAWELNQGADRKDSLLRFPLIFLKRRPGVCQSRPAGADRKGGVRVFSENGKISPRQLRCLLTLDFFGKGALLLPALAEGLTSRNLSAACSSFFCWCSPTGDWWSG